jgi:hypothetical protein
MIAEITEAILNRLKADGLEIREVGFKDLVDKTINLTRPAVNVVVQTATFDKVTLTTYKVRLDVSLIVVFQNVRAGTEGEARRKAGIYKIIEAVIQSLLLQKLDLDLENPLFPVSFRNITSEEYAKAGYQLYQIQMWCSYNFSKKDEEDLGWFDRILAEYYLEPRNYTGMLGVTGPEASDLINCVTGVSA